MQHIAYERFDSPSGAAGIFAALGSGSEFNAALFRDSSWKQSGSHAQ
jgi:hypothetical protein